MTKFTNDSSTSRKNLKSDDSVLSRNHSKSIKYRLRVQQEKEADDEINNYDELKETDAGTTIQDTIRRNHLPD